MTSEERREARYHRRKSKRQANRLKRSKEVGTLQDVFNYHDMFFYGRKCCTGVRWKQSTQNFELHLFSGTAKRRREVLDGKWKPAKKSSPNSKKSYRQKKSIAKQRRQNGTLGRLK